MCSCAPLPHPPFKPAPAPHPNLNPNPNAASAHGPTLLRCALVARAAARDDPPPAPSSFDFLALKRELEEQEEAVVPVDATEGGGDEVVNEEDGEREPKRIVSSGRRTGRQMARRSGLLAKQVISVSSARSLGFVSQLWVDASSWVVALVEVRPSLLSGDADKFLFDDIYQIGDVVLVEDESVVENEFKLVGLHGLVGYNVVTSRRRNVGKVSTYCLFVEDVLDIVSDTIVVHEDAISRVQRLTQGIWGTQNMQGPGDQIGEYNRYGRRRARSVKRQNSQGKPMGRKLHRKTRDPEDEWELPMEY
ncbi:unnamed protein product [Triticum turgidum subsp. durum]|uniref:PRC-barrel domain-containing protein n=3 Tax=Triticum TaxID=4564 RepID=A0A9R0S9D7_TRITD|nr:unnamed protein product [Triticum turgidum subsp. durum]